jgi:hypothetical protein
MATRLRQPTHSGDILSTCKSIFHGELARCSYLMQNLAEEFGQLKPGPSREELNHMLNLLQ